MFTISTDKQKISFTYVKSKIFNNVSLRSAYKAKNLSSNSNDDIVDEFAMSDDEQDAFDICLQNILPDIYERFLKLTSGIDNAYTIGETDVIINILNNNAYNSNVIGMVDASILDCIINGALFKWYETCAHANFQKEYDEKYQISLKKLSNRIFQLKKKMQSSNLGEKV